jgi:c-di-GMP-binding flagellar brake protein YcgR
MTEDPSNRRAYLRFPIDTLVWWNQDWEPEPISLIDISAGGMLVEFPKPLENGTLIELHFEFPGYGRLIQCTCEAVHCRDGEGSYYMIGLRLVDIEGMEQQEFITRLKNGLPISAAPPE